MATIRDKIKRALMKRSGKDGKEELPPSESYCGSSFNEMFPLVSTQGAPDLAIVGNREIALKLAEATQEKRRLAAFQLSASSRQFTTCLLNTTKLYLRRLMRHPQCPAMKKEEENEQAYR